MAFLKRKAKQQIQQETPLPGNPKEMEEDGFLVIGETEDEVKALTPDKQNPNADPPPDYEISQSTCRNHQNSSKTLPETSSTTRQDIRDKAPTNAIDQQTFQRTPKSPLFDVPFKLDDSVACALSHGHLSVDIGDELSWTTSQYDYDFSMERSIMHQSDF